MSKGNNGTNELYKVQHTSNFMVSISVCVNREGEKKRDYSNR